MQILSVAWAVTVAYIVYCIARFLQTYHTARKIGFPICVIPVNFHSTVWRIISVPLRPVFKRHLPEYLSFRLEAGTYGSEYLLRHRLVQRYGSTVVLCGIGSLQVLSADATIINQVLSQPKKFPTALISQSETNWGFIQGVYAKTKQKSWRCAVQISLVQLVMPGRGRGASLLLSSTKRSVALPGVKLWRRLE